MRSRPVGEGVGRGQLLGVAAVRQPLDRRRDQCLSGLEVVQVGAARDAGALGDAAGRRVRVAVLDQAGDRGVEQRFAGGGAALGLAAAGGGLGGGHWSPCYSNLRSRMNVMLRAAPESDQNRRSFDHGRYRCAGVRRDSHAARQGQGQRIPARHQAGRSRRRPDARDAGPQREARPQQGRRRRARLRLAGRRPGRRHRQDRGDQGRPARHRRRRPAQPLLRLRPRGRQHRRAEGRLRLGGPRLRRWRRVDVAGADGLRRRPLGDGPRDQLRHVLHPAGRWRRPDRDDRGASAARTSTPTRPARRNVPPRRARRAASTTA